MFDVLRHQSPGSSETWAHCVGRDIRGRAGSLFAGSAAPSRIRVSA